MNTFLLAAGITFGVLCFGLLLLWAFTTTSLAGFLSFEFKKKFGFMKWIVDNTSQIVSYTYLGVDNHEDVHNRGMRNIVLRHKNCEPFIALVGFRLEVPILNWVGYDYYGRVASDENGIAVISTFLGTDPTIFQFIVMSPHRDDDPRCVGIFGKDIVASSTDEDQKLTASAESTFPPHFYQEKLGFYG